jgi:hypothetical protein
MTKDLVENWKMQKGNYKNFVSLEQRSGDDKHFNVSDELNAKQLTRP